MNVKITKLNLHGKTSEIAKISSCENIDLYSIWSQIQAMVKVREVFIQAMVKVQWPLTLSQKYKW